MQRINKMNMRILKLAQFLDSETWEDIISIKQKKFPIKNQHL